jgi:hypothetical protein
MVGADLSGGLPVTREDIRRVEPDIPFWSDNLLFAVHDPTSGAAMWLHLGTVPNDWSMWHEMNYALLPGDAGVLSMWSFHRTVPELRPAGSNLRFECLEPFRRWRLRFDGHGLRTTLEEMQEGPARVGPTMRWCVDLEIEGRTPAWDYHTGVSSQMGRGSMHDQGWAREHYEQMYLARGTVRFGDEERAFDGYGWRDHSQGPRGGGGGAPWGGHVTAGSVAQDGHGWGGSRFWGPDGTVTLEAGWISDDDGLHHAEVLEAPAMTDLALGGEELNYLLRWEGGTVEATITTTRSLWLSMQRGLTVGRDTSGPGLMFVPAWGTSTWDGKNGSTYIERSNPMNAPITTFHRG